MFSAKTYSDVRNALAGANVILAAGLLAVAYLFVLTPQHKQAFHHTLQTLTLDPVVGSLITAVLLVAVWGYITTALIRLHDRLYEPHLVSWRRSYESDFILRSLCLAYPARISSRLFDEAFTDVVRRQAFMQRLFYKFVGDFKEQHQELLQRFYTVARNYWILVLAETYCVAFLMATIVYCYLSSPPSPPYGSLLTALVGAVGFRVWANLCLPSMRPITVEQIGVVLREHREEFEKELDALVKEYGLQP